MKSQSFKITCLCLLAISSLVSSSPISLELESTPRASIKLGADEVPVIGSVATYSVMVDVGSNDQKIKVQVDSGSGILWVAGPSAGLTDPFVCSQSSTCEKGDNQLTLNYGSGSVTGDTATDQVNLGGAQVSNFKFLIANSVSGRFRASPFSGVLGFGPTDNSNFDNMFLRQLKSQGAISQAAFGIYIGKNFGTQPQTTGYLDLGGIGSDYYNSQFVNSSISSNKYLGISCQSINYGSGNIFSGGSTAVIDTGSSFLGFSSAIINSLVRRTGENCNVVNNVVVCPCNSPSQFEALNFEFEGGRVTLPATAYWGMQSGKCILEVQAAPEGFLILGSNFLSEFYTVFDLDNQIIGFTSPNGSVDA